MQVKITSKTVLGMAVGAWLAVLPAHYSIWPWLASLKIPILSPYYAWSASIPIWQIAAASVLCAWIILQVLCRRINRLLATLSQSEQQPSAMNESA